MLLTEELKTDHAMFFDSLEKIRQLGVTTREGQQELASLKQSLIIHIRKEDSNLYPVLRRAAEKDANLRQTLELFARDMDDVSKNTLLFLDKYSRGGSGTEFAKDFGRLYATLRTRMGKEENTLYREFDRLNKAA